MICCKCKHWSYTEVSKAEYGRGFGICLKSGLPMFCNSRCVIDREAENESKN